MKMTTFLKTGAAPLALGFALVASPVMAQVTDGNDSGDGATTTASGENADGTAATGNAIIVTGSRIPRPNIEAPSPVTVVGAEQVQLTGTTTVESLLNELPQVIPGNTRVSNNSGGENFSTIDLRGLGPGRTLILLNGERLPASTTTGVTDVSQIPTGLIDRIEVVTGGASATYGSDAIAGVVNFILKDDFQGVQLTGQTGVSEAGAGYNYNVSGLVGGNFADGRGNMTFYGSYTSRSAVSQARFPYSRTSAAIILPYDINNCDAASNPLDCPYGVPFVADNPSQIDTGAAYYPYPAVGGGSATPPWGIISASANGPASFTGLGTLLPGTFGAGNTDTNCDGVAGGAVNNPTSVSFNDAGQLAPNNASGFSTPQCALPLRTQNGSSRFNYGPLNYLITPMDRLTLTINGKYEFDDKTRLHIYSSYTNATQQVALAPTPATGIVVDVNSPLIPADLAAALASRQYYARGAGTDVNGDAYGTGRFSSASGCANSVDDPTVVCTPTSAANEPFVINRRFSETGPRIGDFTTDAKSVRAILEHDLNDKWSVNLVGSYGRVDNIIRNQGNIRASAVNQGLAGCPDYSAPGCVPVDIFGPNTLTPAMLSFVSLTTTDSERFEQTRVAANITGSLFNLPGGPVGVAAGVEYRKDSGATYVDDAKRTGDIIGFNAQNDISGSIDVTEFYGEVRLPVLNILSLGAGGRYSDYSSVGGLFNWKAEAELTPLPWVKIRGTYNKAARAPNVFELFQNGNQGFPSYTDPCNSTVSNRDDAFCIAQGVPAGAIGTFQQDNSQVQAFAFGNPNLEAEKAETWTAGLVLTPGNIFGVNATLTVDYYNIHLTNRVSSLGASYFLSQCYSAQDLNACARIVRDPATGQITQIDTSTGNSATPLDTAGVDVGLDLKAPAFGGQIYVSDVLTYVDKYKIGDTNYVDTVFSGIGGVTPKWANTVTAGWRNEKFTAQVRYVWKKGGKQNFPGADLDGLYPYDPQTGASYYDQYPDRIPDLNLVNLSLRWQATEQFELTFIVNDLLNKFPPQTTTGVFEQANTNISFYDPYALGRNYAVQARVNF